MNTLSEKVEDVLTSLAKSNESDHKSEEREFD